MMRGRASMVALASFWFGACAVGEGLTGGKDEPEGFELPPTPEAGHADGGDAAPGNVGGGTGGESSGRAGQGGTGAKTDAGTGGTASGGSSSGGASGDAGPDVAVPIDSSVDAPSPDASGADALAGLGASGSAGTAGSAGASGSAGAAGSSGSGGAAGAAGSSGAAGTGGSGGSGGCPADVGPDDELKCPGKQLVVATSGTTTVSGPVDNSTGKDHSLSCGGGGNDSVYRFVAPAAGTVRVTLTPNGVRGTLYVTKTSCASAVVADQLFCMNPGTIDTVSTNTFTAVACETYWVFADQDLGVFSGTFQLDIAYE